jgi:hypothetical protein
MKAFDEHFKKNVEDILYYNREKGILSVTKTVFEKYFIAFLKLYSEILSSIIKIRYGVRYEKCTFPYENWSPDIY